MTERREPGLDEAEPIAEGQADGKTGNQSSAGALSPTRSGLSRRRFLGRGSLGVVGAGVLASVPGLPSFLGGAASETTAASGDASVVEGDAGGASQAVVAHVRDVRNGIIDLHINGATVNVRNPQLAQQIARAAR